MLKEIIALAMAGYKKKDIDAILEMENKEMQKSPGETHKDEENLQESKDPEKKKDFEALYNETLKTLGETQEKLALATRENSEKEVGKAGGKSQEDVLNELTKLLNR